MNNTHFLELTETRSAAAREAFALYEASFPPAERVPVEAMQRSVERRAAAGPEGSPTGHFRVAVRAGHVLGLSAWGYFCRSRLGFLYYLAVDPALRGQGIGAWLLRETLAHLHLDAAACSAEPPHGLVWEVVRPKDAADPAGRDLRQRRIDFYRRQGAVVLEQIDFTAPPLAAGLPQVPYHIMFLPSEGFEGDSGDAGFQASVLRMILREGYGVEEG